MIHILKKKGQNGTGKKLILVGYSDTAKEYRLYDLDNNSVIINRDCNGRYKGRC